MAGGRGGVNRPAVLAETTMPRGEGYPLLARHRRDSGLRTRYSPSSATHSTSTCEPAGSRAACTVLRAGGALVK